MNVLADAEVERALVVVAHPDDAEFWAGGTVACWSSADIEVTYLVLTDGDSGGVDREVDRAAVPGIRRAEQEEAARVLGVREVVFFGLQEGSIEQGEALRRRLVRVIRTIRPQRLLTWSPEWNWSRFRTSCHMDHRATGEVALTAVYPDAGNAFTHPSLLQEEGLEPWTVTEIWMLNGREQNHYVDVTDTFERKVEALRAHRSQTGHRDGLAAQMRERIAPNATAAGLLEGRLAEAFQVVRNG